MGRIAAAKRAPTPSAKVLEAQRDARAVALQADARTTAKALKAAQAVSPARPAGAGSVGTTNKKRKEGGSGFPAPTKRAKGSGDPLGSLSRAELDKLHERLKAARRAA